MAAPTCTTGTGSATALHHYRGLNWCQEVARQISYASIVCAYFEDCGADRTAEAIDRDATLAAQDPTRLVLANVEGARTYDHDGVDQVAGENVDAWRDSAAWYWRRAVEENAAAGGGREWEAGVA